MPKENRTKFAILGMLDFFPMSGYDIRKMSAISISHFWKEDYGHIYPTLKLLLEEALATKEEEPSGEGKPGRHVYSITPKGRQALVEWLSEAPNPPNLRIELLLKVFFGARGKAGDMAAMLEAQEAACSAARDELLGTEKHILREIEAGGERGRMARFQLMTLRYGKRYYESLGEWCRETLEELGAAD
jgi:PadR family transcriptional regulator, regulatory protein AphA